jgi:hypothetical protein
MSMCSEITEAFGPQWMNAPNERVTKLGFFGTSAQLSEDNATVQTNLYSTLYFPYNCTT